MIRDPVAVFVVLALVVFVAVYLERRVRAVRAIGSMLTAIVLAALLSNLGVIPSASPAYDRLGSVGVNLGIALILLGVDIRSVVRSAPTMVGAFVLGSVGTIVGAIAGTVLLRGAVGPETWKLAGQYTGTYIGGGVNMVSVGRGLDTSAELFTAAIAADNVTTNVWMIVCLLAPLALARFWPSEERAGGGLADGKRVSSVAHVSEFTATNRSFTLLDATAVFLLASTGLWIAERLGDVVPGVPPVLWLTTLTLAAAQIGPVRRLSGGPVLGNYLLHLFLAGLGAQSIVREIFRVGPAVFYFTLVVVGLHGLLLFGVGRLLRLDLRTLVVASQANVGGPASAMAIATARGYSDLIVPGVAVGLLGYAVGNYAGFAVAGIMRTLFAG